jgi:putative ABC transport system permease protein
VVAAIAAQSATQTPAWGLLATALIVAAVALAARPLLALMSPSLLAALRAVAGPSAALARGTLSSGSSRAVLTAAMLGVGVGAIIWLRMLAYSFETSLVDALSGAMQGDWVVSSSRTAQGFLEAPIDEGVIAQLQQVEGVEQAVGERLVDWEYGGGPIAIDAFDARYFTTGTFGRLALVGTSLPDVWSALSAGTAVLVSGNLGVAVGDPIVLRTPRGPLTVRVGGMTIDFGSPRGTIVMSRDLYGTHWDDQQVNRVFVKVAPDFTAEQVRGAIAQQLGVAYGLRIISARELMNYFAAQVRRAFAPVDVLAALMLVVLFVGLADALAASVFERTRELAVIRALGGRRALLRRAVVIEGLGLGLPGILLAITAGLGLGALWVRQTFPYLLGWPLETYVPYRQVGIVCMGILVVCWLAALLPARRAAALQVAEALRCE